MCGAQKQLGANGSGGSKTADSTTDAFRLRRANQLRKSKRQWKRQRGSDGTYTWVRQMEDEEIEINLAIDMELDIGIEIDIEIEIDIQIDFELDI